MENIYIIIGIVILLLSYYIFYRKDTFINKKMEKFNGDDLNVHMENDLNVVNEEKTIK